MPKVICRKEKRRPSVRCILWSGSVRIQVYMIIIIKCGVTLVHMFVWHHHYSSFAMNSSSSASLYYSSLPYPPLHGWHEESEGAGQQDVIVILAFISGASFITLTILLILCAACRWGKYFIDSWHLCPDGEQSQSKMTTPPHNPSSTT